MIYDHQGEMSSSGHEDVASLLSRRFPPSNWNVFYMTTGKNKYPLLQIHVKEDMAVLHYFPAEGNAGYISKSGDSNHSESEMIAFPESQEGAEMEVASYAAVPIKYAMEAAEEFMASNRLPDRIDWLEL